MNQISHTLLICLRSEASTWIGYFDGQLLGMLYNVFPLLAGNTVRNLG